MNLIFQLYYFVLPFIAFVGIGLERPDLVWGIALLGWLPLIIFHYFSYAKTIVDRMTVFQYVMKIVIWVLISYIQFVLLKASSWSFFVSVMLFELAALSVAFVLHLILTLPDALQKKYLLSSLVAIVLLASGAGYMVYYLFIMDGLVAFTISALGIGLALLVDIAQEYSLLQKVFRRKELHTLDDSGFEKRTPLYALGMIFWIVGIPVVLHLLGK